MEKFAFYVTQAQAECLRAIEAGTFDSRTVAALEKSELIKQNGHGPQLTERGRMALSLVAPPPAPPPSLVARLLSLSFF